jgi:DNA-3-methyladenine glycosylase
VAGRSSRLTRSFYARSAVDVAPELLGCILQVGNLRVRLTETEAYLPEDEASHSFRGRTKRNEVMFGSPGHAYVYFVYGMYWCLNVVTGPPGDGQAVLLRGGSAIAGVEEMRRNRPKCLVDAKLADGPGKLAIALGINGSHNGLDLCSSYRFCLRNDGFVPHSIEAGPRVGISKNVDKPWRFRVR